MNASWLPPANERFHAPFALATLVGLLAERGVAEAVVLAGTGLEPAALRDVAVKVSIEQYLQACGNARRCSDDPGLAFALGARGRLSDHGLYGLLLQSCASVRDVFRLAVEYQWLAAPVVAMDAEDARWVIEPEALRDVPEALRSFVVERQFAQQATHLREIAGDDCRPVLACFAHPAPPHRPPSGAAALEALGCPCAFDGPRHELRYDERQLARRPRLANPLAVRTLQSACDALVADIETSLGFAGKVYRTLRRMPDPGARMKVVAIELKMTDRTLRRRLADEGTCFSTISHRVRCAVATQHLKTSASSIDEIASIAGFSDPANFRRAFIRWTSMSPARFRRLQRA